MSEKQHNRPLVATVIKPLYQQLSRERSKVGVQACIFLRGEPDNEDGIQLDKNLCYEAECELMGCTLSSAWGYNIIDPMPELEGGYRYLVKVFTADTWKEAYNMSRKYLDSEINKLKKVMKEREKALKAAGKRPEPEINIIIP